MDSPTIELTLLPDQQQRTFQTIDDVYSFLGEERRIWKNAGARTLAQRFLDFRSKLEQLHQADPEFPQILKKTIQGFENSKPRLIYSTTAEGTFLRGVQQRFGGPHTGENAYSILSGNAGISPSEPEGLIGVVAAALYRGASLNERADSEVAAAASSRERIAQVQDEVEKILKENREHLSDIVAAQAVTRGALTLLESNAKETLASTVATLNESNDKAFGEWRQGFQQITEDASLKAKALETLYEQKLQLEKPARHWQNLQRIYEKRGRGWLISATVLSIAFMYLIVRLLYIPPEALEHHAFAGAMGVRGLVLLAVLISIAVYLIRFLFKLSTSAFHLSRDARERAQLTYFYLALLKADKSSINTDERKIILQALFARADTGLLSSDGPSMPGMPGSLGAIWGGVQGSHGK